MSEQGKEFEAPGGLGAKVEPRPQEVSDARRIVPHVEPLVLQQDDGRRTIVIPIKRN